MFDFESLSESFKSAIPSQSYLSFTIYEWNYILDGLSFYCDHLVNDFPEQVEYYQNVQKVFEKICSYEFH